MYCKIPYIALSFPLPDEIFRKKENRKLYKPLIQYNWNSPYGERIRSKTARIKSGVQAPLKISHFTQKKVLIQVSILSYTFLTRKGILGKPLLVPHTSFIFLILKLKQW